MGGKRGDPIVRFWRHVEKSDGGCWLWTGAKADVSGYGAFNAGRGKRVRAHRWIYEQTVGPVPSGMHVDHLCRNPACVRLDHLEAVTPRENWQRRPNAENTRTRCPHGHAYAPENTYRHGSHRYCRACARAKNRRIWPRMSMLRREKREREKQRRAHE